MSVVSLRKLPSREAMPGLHGRFIHSERTTLAFWRIEKGAVLPEHHHPHEQIANILKGRFELVVDGKRHALKAGDAFIIPPNAVHSGKALTECEILDVFSPTREDYQL